MSKPFRLVDRLASFKYALTGILKVIKHEHNFRIHLVAAIIVIVAGFYFQVTTNEWLWLIGAIVSVLSLEMINTAIEKLVDLKEPEYNPKAGLIKDIAAGAVLIASIGALAIGVIIFWPYFCL